MKPGLSDYAISHLILVAINKRFETVIARQPKRLDPVMRWRIDHARQSARDQFNSYPMTLKMFDYYVHGRLFS